MTDLRTAAQQALEALEHGGPAHRLQAMNALRAALAQPIDIEAEADRRGRVLAAEMRAALAQPAPVPAARKPLTEEEIDECFESVMFNLDIEPTRELIARAIERKIRGEKE